MTDKTAARVKEPFFKIDPSACSSNNGWQRFLEIMFPGIEQIDLTNPRWRPVNDFLRIIGWLMLKAV